MGQFEIPVVIDEEILNKIPDRTRYVLFLLFWLSEHNITTITLKSCFKKFIDKWKNNLKETDEKEIQEPFFTYIHGAVSPYEKPGEDDDEDVNSIKEIIKIINRDYDTVRYLIVEDPEKYKGDLIKISDERIVDLKGFYITIKLLKPDLVKKFDDEYKHLTPR